MEITDWANKRNFDVLGTDVETRSGTIDAILRRGATVVFLTHAQSNEDGTRSPEVLDARKKAAIRRAAVAWMATYPQHQKGVRAYRFDVLFDGDSLIRNAF